MSETFHQAVCHDCTAPGTQKTWRTRAFTDRSHGEIRASTHDRRKHDSETVAAIRSFESESVGSLPRTEPPIDDSQEGAA